jgi:hypothetical protein
MIVSVAINPNQATRKNAQESVTQVVGAIQLGLM